MILASPPIWMLPATVLAALAYGFPALAGERLNAVLARRSLAQFVGGARSFWVCTRHFCDILVGCERLHGGKPVFS